MTPHHTPPGMFIILSWSYLRKNSCKKPSDFSLCTREEKSWSFPGERHPCYSKKGRASLSPGTGHPARMELHRHTGTELLLFVSTRLCISWSLFQGLLPLGPAPLFGYVPTTRHPFLKKVYKFWGLTASLVLHFPLEDSQVHIKILNVFIFPYESVFCQLNS